MACCLPIKNFTISEQFVQELIQNKALIENIRFLSDWEVEVYGLKRENYGEKTTLLMACETTKTLLYEGEVPKSVVHYYINFAIGFNSDTNENFVPLKNGKPKYGSVELYSKLFKKKAVVSSDENMYEKIKNGEWMKKTIKFKSIPKLALKNIEKVIHPIENYQQNADGYKILSEICDAEIKFAEKLDKDFEALEKEHDEYLKKYLAQKDLIKSQKEKFNKEHGGSVNHLRVLKGISLAKIEERRQPVRPIVQISSPKQKQNVPPAPMTQPATNEHPVVTIIPTITSGIKCEL